MLSIYENSDNLFNALKAGASGYLLKSSSPDVLYDAVRDVMMGGALFSSHIARQVVRHFRGVGEAASLKERLTPREKEVIELLAAGYLLKSHGNACYQTDCTPFRYHIEGFKSLKFEFIGHCLS